MVNLKQINNMSYRDRFACTKKSLYQFIFLLFTLTWGQSLQADLFNFEKLIMPGPLINSHADLENDCKNCHKSLDESAEERLCLDCHEEIDKDFENGTGFHGLQVKTPQCKFCHTDHKGREFNNLNFDRDSFNHELTDFPLDGKHAKASCDSCHKPDERFMNEKTRCIDCHKEDDVHNNQLGNDCKSCHITKDWKTAEFDHDTTDFPLISKHSKVSCNACHADNHYENTPKDCYSCHAINDVHAGTNGKDCTNCHIETAWEKVAFDHNEDTKFKLTGSHQTVSCNSCHIKPKYEESPGTTCHSCHKQDDKHQGKHGTQCQSCHLTTKWKNITFKHEVHTDFPLLGMHSALVCDTCHQSNPYKEQLKTQCVTCHERDDIHKGQQGNECERCHNESGWNDNVIFDHDITGFPLIGLHSSTSCEECHISGTFKGIDSECSACHENDDTHKSTLGNQCQLCHNPNGWALWLFNHDTQTDFILDGSHKNLSCESCHTEPVINEVQQDKQCVACHADDDIHNNKFGDKCDACHITKSFKDLQKMTPSLK